MEYKKDLLRNNEADFYEETDIYIPFRWFF